VPQPDVRIAPAGEREDLEIHISQALAGDLRAFEALYRLEGGRVFAIAFRMTGRRDLAEDLTQECFVKAWQRLGTFSRERSFSAWLRRIAINVVLDALRSEARSRKIEERVAPSPAAFRVDSALDLERAIQLLPERARAVFVLHDVEGFRHDEIARLMGVTEGTCKAQLHRARRLLRGELDT